MSLKFKIFVNSFLFIMARSSVLFVRIRKIIWKSNIVEKPFILIFFGNTVADLILGS